MKSRKTLLLWILGGLFTFIVAVVVRHLFPHTVIEAHGFAGLGNSTGAIYYKADSLEKRRAAFLDRFKVGGTTMLTSASDEIPLGLILPMVAGDKAIVFHYGYFSSTTLPVQRRMSYAISIVDTKALLTPPGHPYYRSYDLDKTSFYWINGGALHAPAAGVSNNKARKDWYDSGLGKEYFAYIQVQRSQNAQRSKYDPLDPYLDPHMEVFDGDALEALSVDNPTGKFLRISSISIAGMDTSGVISGHTHVLALTLLNAGLEELVNDQGGSGTLTGRALDLGNICPPKCKRVVPWRLPS